MTNLSPLLRLLMATATGILSGFGIGGGSLLVILLTLWGGANQHTAQGMNLLYFLPTAASSLLWHGKQGRVDWRVWLPTAVAGAVFAALGAFLSLRMDTALLRRFFGVLLIYPGLRELLAKERKTAE